VYRTGDGSLVWPGLGRDTKQVNTLFDLKNFGVGGKKNEI